MSIVPGIPVKTYTSNNNNDNGPNLNNHGNNSSLSDSTAAGTIAQRIYTDSKSTDEPDLSRLCIDIEDLTIIQRNETMNRQAPPIVPSLCPYRVHLKPGRKYKYCACGRSRKQPWCDETHLPTDPQPIEFMVSKEQTWHWICGCKYSNKQPFCDGSHIHARSGTEEVDYDNSSNNNNNSNNNHTDKMTT